MTRGGLAEEAIVPTGETKVTIKFGHLAAIIAQESKLDQRAIDLILQRVARYHLTGQDSEPAFVDTPISSLPHVPPPKWRWLMSGEYDCGFGFDPVSESDLIGTREAAEIAGCSTATMYRYGRERGVGAIILGCHWAFSRTRVESLIAAKPPLRVAMSTKR
jgi:hypothetical protein